MAKKIRGLGGKSIGKRSSKKSNQLNEMMKQAQKAQERMGEIEEKFKDIEVSATSGGGAVEVTASCDYRIKDIQINEDLKEEEFEIVQDLIIAGVNEVLENIKKKRDEETSKLTGDLNLPEDILNK
ncbi:MAG: YbaB/EbfC family nucleoid-associated protein [Thermotogota bacterium]|nr:YbaB/EbfC family nucleoid-associated protein [Thermotogota bacterium]